MVLIKLFTSFHLTYSSEQIQEFLGFTALNIGGNQELEGTSYQNY